MPDLISLASNAAPLLIALMVKGALLLAVALAVVALMGRASAASRHAVLVTALAGLLVLPVLITGLPAWNVSVPVPAQSAIVVDEVPAAVLQPALAPMAPIAGETTATPPAPAPRAEVAEAAPGFVAAVTSDERARSVVGAVSLWITGAWSEVVALVPGKLLDWRLSLVLMWLIGVGIVAGRWVSAFVSAHRLLANAVPLDDLAWRALAARTSRRLGLKRQVRILRSDRLAVPVAWCFGRAAVVLPADCEEWSQERREVVLLHELAHVARHDGATQVAGQVAVALHWFNPLAWLAYRRLLVEREQACDDLVLALGTRASTYAEHLMQIARRFRQEPLSLLAVAAMARRADLSGRIEAILDPRQPRGRISADRVTSIAAGVCVLMLPLAAFNPVAPSAQAPVAAAEPASSETVHVQDDWRWEGRASAGDLVEIYGLNGAITVREGGGNAVRVTGTPQGRNARNARLEVNDVRGGIVICVVYPGQSGCEAGRGPSGRARQTNNASVSLDVVVPARVRVQARTTNGAIRADDLQASVDARTTNGAIRAGSRTGDVRARTTNGAVTLTANGRVDAATTNGSITATFLSTDWSGSSSLSTTNGSVTVHLPDGANVAVDAATTTGSIRTDFDGIEVVRRRGPGATASGTIGRGGRQLAIRTTNGAVRIQRGTGRTGALLDHSHDGVAHAGFEFEGLGEEIAYVDWQAILEQAMTAQKDARHEVERARLQMESIDWEAIHEKHRAGMEQARAELEAIDWEAIHMEHRAALAEARAELDAVDWDAIRAESLRAQDIARVEVARAIAEIEQIDWSAINAEISEALEEVRRELRSLQPTADR